MLNNHMIGGFYNWELRYIFVDKARVEELRSTGKMSNSDYIKIEDWLLVEGLNYDNLPDKHESLEVDKFPKFEYDPDP